MNLKLISKGLLQNMKIVHIEDFFYPMAGYQINILPKYLQKIGHENIIISSEYDKTPKSLREFFDETDIDNKDNLYSKEANVKIIRMPIRRFISGRALWKFKKLVKIIEDINPDIVYVHGNDTLIGMQLIAYYRNKKRKIITDSHMLEMASKNKFNKLFRLLYKSFITPIINKNNINVIRVQDTDFIFTNYGISRRLSPFISFGTDVDLFNKSNTFQNDILRKKLGIRNELVYLYTGKINEEKGSKLLFESFQKKFNNKEVTLLVVGKIPSNEYGKNLLNIINNSENQIIVVGTQEYTNLYMYYNLATFAIFPKQCSLSFYDLQSLGIPIIFEENEINNMREKGINLLFEPNSKESLRKIIIETIKLDSRKYLEKSKNAEQWIKSEYDYNNLVRIYEDILKRAIGEK